MHRFLPRPHLFLNRTMLHATLPNRGAQCRSSECLPRRCCDTLDLTNILQTKMHQWQKREGQPTEEIEAQKKWEFRVATRRVLLVTSLFRASRLLLPVIVCCANIAFFGTLKEVYPSRRSRVRANIVPFVCHDTWLLVGLERGAVARSKQRRG